MLAGTAKAVWSLRVGSKNRETKELLMTAADSSTAALKAALANQHAIKDLAGMLSKLADSVADDATKDQLKQAKKDIEMHTEQAHEEIESTLDEIQLQIQALDT